MSTCHAHRLPDLLPTCAGPTKDWGYPGPGVTVEQTKQCARGLPRGCLPAACNPLTPFAGYRMLEHLCFCLERCSLLHTQLQLGMVYLLFRYVDAVDTLGQPDFDTVLVDGRCDASRQVHGMHCRLAGVRRCHAHLLRMCCSPPSARLCHLPSAPCQTACTLDCWRRFRVACALKVLRYLTDNSVVLVHDWEQR